MTDDSSVWVRTEPTLDGKSFMVTIEFDPDTATTLTRVQTHDYIDTIYEVVARAEYDAAVFQQMRKVLNQDKRQAAAMVLDLRERRDALPGLGPMSLVPGMNVHGKPFLTLHVNGQPVGQWSPDDARGHASHVLDALAVAELDKQYLAMLTDVIGIEEDRARNVVDDLGEVAMTEIPASVRAMVDDSQAPTAPLEDFIKAYEADDNWWWRIGCGHHQNLFEAAADRAGLL